MKTKWGALIVEGRGKIGGYIASKNRGGAYMKAKISPSNPQSTAQTLVRSEFTVISQSWKLLTDAERLSWNGSVSNFAKTDIFGDLRNPSGSNLYQSLNLNLANIGQSYITTPPQIVTSPAPLIITVTANGTSPALSIAWTSGAIAAGFTVVVESTAGQSAGRSFFKSKFRKIGLIAAAATTPSNQLSNYTAKFGSLIPGTKIGVRVKLIDNTTGQASLFYSVIVDVA
jgi:hypothetical protein